MNQEPSTGPPGSPPEQVHDPPDRDWLELRMLLLGREQERLRRIEERLDSDDVRSEEVSAVLPEIITRGIEKNPLRVSEALLLVIGPAIRNAMSAALQEMLRNLDRLLKNSFSPTTWRWRLEALRTGRPFAEIVMLHSLQYRVEQVFLVHRRTSLVIRHVQLPSTRGQDPDLVSAMLSAIQDFIHLSFDSGEYARLHVVQAGDLTIWIEQGPLAFLAAAIRGSPPLELRIQFRSVLDEIHAKYSSDLQNFQGDAAPFEPAAELLESCLVFRLTEQPEKKKKPVFALSFCAMVAMLVAVASLLFVIEARRWTAYVAQLNKEPGIHVTSAQNGLWQHSISGLRDPLGADPMQILRNTAVAPKKVRADWRPYLSAAPELVLLRARRRLNPPAGVALAFDAGTLRAFGVAPPAWTAAAGKSALSIPGVERFDAAGIESPEQRQFEKLKASIETPIVFDSGSAVLTPQLAEVAQNAAASLGELTKLADTAAKTLQVRVVGHPDMDGVGLENPALGRKRAQAVAAILKSHGIESDLFDVIGVGTTQPPGQGISEEDKAYNRSVVIRVTWKDRSSDQGSNP